MRARLAAVLVAMAAAAAAPALANIATATLEIRGVSLEVKDIAVTTGVDIPATIQTRYGGRLNEEAPAVEGLIAVGDLTGPGLETPIRLSTAPGHRFQIPGLSRPGVYQLQNVRLMKGDAFILPATPSVATITVADLLQTSVSVRQLTPDELRARGIPFGGAFDVYEYSFSFLIDGQEVVIPFPVAIDPSTHEVIPIGRETPYVLPPVSQIQPPRWTPPEIIPFEFPVETQPFPQETTPQPSAADRRVVRPRIPAALVIPNSLAVLHQFFGVILTVSNGAPLGSTARLDAITATVEIPAALRSVKSEPAVGFGQPVPIVDAANGVTFLVAQAKGEAEWTLEGLASGTHTVEIDVRATYREEGQQPVQLRGRPRASIVVHDARFNITFSHPDTVRQGLDYATHAFVTNTSAAQQTIRMTNGLPACDQSPAANVCRLGGAQSDEITLAAGEMQMVEYKLRSSLTGRVFATAGTIGSENLTAAVQLRMGVSETGIPLSPATLILPHYAQYLSPSLVSAQLQLLGLGYGVATAPVTPTTATFPRVIKTDVFYRAVDISRAGQKVFIADAAPAASFAAMANLSLDLLGNGVELREWDQLRRTTPSGRAAGAAMTAELNAAGMAGSSTIGEFVDDFAAATSHRKPFVAAVVHGPATAAPRPYALSVRTLAGGYLDVPNEAGSSWKRGVAFGDLSNFDVAGLNRAGEIALVGRWSGDLDLLVTPAASGPLSMDIIYPAGAEGGFLRGHLDVNGRAGETLRVSLTPGNSQLEAILSNGGMAAVNTSTPVERSPLRIVGARQDLHLDPEGHKVSVLLNRPVTVPAETDLRPSFAGTIVFDGDGVNFRGSRPIFAAALQEGRDVVNLSFDHVLAANATYAIEVNSIGANALAAPQIVVPKIENDRPAGILFGRFLKGDNSPIADSEVRLYTGHFRGCEVSLLGDDPPPDCNPYREAPQYAATDRDGRFLFEYVPRDPIVDPELSGGYRLLGVDRDGRFTIVNGAVRRPGSVHFVNLQLLGRGAAEGTVRYETGERVAGAEVFVGSTMFNAGRRTHADASGLFRVDDLPVGPITFSAKDEDGNTSFGSGEIAAPGEIARKDLVIVRQPFPGTGIVRGSVVRSDDGKPVAGARVGVSSHGYGLSEALTGADGRFEFTKVPAGFVTVLAAEWTVATDSASWDFDLRADEVQDKTLILPVRTPDSTSATLNGIVVREDPLHQGDPAYYQRVSGAVVTLGDRPPATTDAAGHFSFDAVPLAWATAVDVHAYDPETKRIGKIRLPAMTEEGPNNVSVFLPASAFGDGLIRVRLLTASGSPAAGYRVVAPALDVAFEEKVPGVYEYVGAPVGSEISVAAFGGSGGEQFVMGQTRLSFPGQIATLTLRLPGEGTVRVRLRSDLDLIGDVAISYPVWDEAEKAPVEKTRSASTGREGTADRAAFTRVPARGTYHVESLHPIHGYATAAGVLAYDGDLIDHTLQLNRLSSVGGTVYAIDGATPVGGANVRIEDGRRDAGSRVTEADGTFVFHDVPAATPVKVIAETAQSGIYRTGVAYGVTPQSGGPLQNMSVILRRRGSIEGRVVYKDYKVFDRQNPSNNVADETPGTLADNAPVPLAKFWLRELGFPAREFGSDAAPLAADAAGRFAVPSVFVGPVRARAWDPANQELEGAWTGELIEEGEIRSDVFVAVGGGGTGAIAVTVVDPNQQLLPIANAEVSLYAGGLFDLASTDGTGVAQFQQVPAGSYSLTAYSKSLGKSGASIVFPVARDEMSELRVLLEFSGQVTGSLTDPESVPANGPVVGAPVTLTGAIYQARASTDSGGEFLFEGVREGSFALDAKDLRSNRRARATRSLSAADPEPRVDLQLEPTESLHVQVYLPDDAGAASTTLAPPVEVTVSQRAGDYVRTAQDNPVVFPGLFRDEPYTITLREIGGQSRTLGARVSFPAGNVASPLTFVFPAYGSVDVRATQGGTPAGGARIQIGGGGRYVTLFADAEGRAVAHQVPLGHVAAQATSIDSAMSGSAAGVLARSSVPLVLTVDLGAYAGVTGLVEAESGGPSQGTRVVATFAGRVVEAQTDVDGRYAFHGIPTQPGTTTPVDLLYVGPDGNTVGARQSSSVSSVNGSQIVTLPPVRLDATPPQLVEVSPTDGAVDASPDSFIRFIFSEAIQLDQISNTFLQLVEADGSGQILCSFDSPVAQADGRVVITMRPPPAAAGQRFPLKSNTLYRIIVSGQITDRTSHPLPSARGFTFTTSDYAEPRVVKIVPDAATPAVKSQTFEFHFNEPIETAPWQSGGSAVFRFYKIAAPNGSILGQLPGSAFVDLARPARLFFAPADALTAESFYRAVFSGVRDLQGNPLPEQTFEFFSFDETPPFVRLVSPVPDGGNVVSGVAYLLGVDVRNGGADAAAAVDVKSVTWSRLDGTAESLLATNATSPFGYRFVAPESEAEGSTLALRARATDRSGNISDPATITFTVRPNVSPADLELTLTPSSVYPGNPVTASATFVDEGIAATVQVTLRAAKRNGVDYADSIAKEVRRASVADPWPPADLLFTLPPDLATTNPALVSVTVTDVRGLSSTATETLTLIPDVTEPAILTLAPAAETRFALHQQYRAEAVVRDETAVEEVTFHIDGQTHRVPGSTSTAGPQAGTRRFLSPLITVPAKNADTRISIVITATDYHGNRATAVTEVLYAGVNDPAVPTAAWICPVDRAALPAATARLSLPLRVRATDDISITAVRFIVPGVAQPVGAARVGSTDVFSAVAEVDTPAAGEPFVITAEVTDADPDHTIRLPISIDLVAIDRTIDATQAVTAGNLAEFENRSLLVRSGTGRLVPHVPLTLKNLIILDGGAIESLATTTLLEHRAEITIVDHLYVDCDSSIDVSAKGYLGGWGLSADGSNRRNESAAGRTSGNSVSGGAQNAGASHGGLAQLADALGAANETYGSIREPQALGSGGGGTPHCCEAGGPGGGAIALRSSTAGGALGRFALAGAVRADGGTGVGGGSGGSILLSAKQLVLGASALVTANGGPAAAAGGGGRLALSASERLDIGSPLSQLQAFGGRTTSEATLAAAPGSVFLKRPSQQHGELLVAAYGTADSPTPLTRATPLSESGLTFDRVELGRYALARFDESFTIRGTVDERMSATIDATAVLVLPADGPAASIATVPAEGANLIRAGDVGITLDATSIARLSEMRMILSGMPMKLENITGYPMTVTARASRFVVPFDAPLGAATLNVRITDRAGRSIDLPPVSYMVVDNAPPLIESFTAVPDQLYPGRSVAVTLRGSDDVRVTKLAISSQIGSVSSAQSVWPDSEAAAHTFTVAVPIDTPGGTPMTIEGAVEDAYPSRLPTKQIRTITILTDTNAPAVTITEPAAGAIVDEASGATFNVRASAVDAEVGIRTITARAGSETAVAMVSAGGDSFRVTLPVPNVDGVDPVPLDVTVTASDHAGGARSAAVRIFVRPLVDPHAPVLRWTCGGAGAMFPAAYATKLRVFAKGATGTNGVQKVEFFIGDAGTLLAAAAVSGMPDHYEATWTTPDLPDGTPIRIRATAMSVGGNQSDLGVTAMIVKSNVPSITGNLTIDPSNAATYAHQTVIVQGGTVTVVGEQTFARLLVLGGIVTHPPGGANALQLKLAEDTYVGCGGAIDVNGRGFAPMATYPGAGTAAPSAGGSHLGRGGHNNGVSGETFGSVYRPREAGGGGGATSFASAGGGVVRIEAGTVAVEGAILANGAVKNTTGAGGSIWITAAAIRGSGTIEARGGDTNQIARGGGGAIAIEYTDPSSTLPNRRADTGGTGTLTHAFNGGAGTIYVKGPSSTYGELTIDGMGRVGQPTELPALGRGTAGSGSSGATLVTGRSAEIPPYFEGHWVEITGASGALKGTWRIGSILSRTVTLVPNAAGETVSIEPGDGWQGVYRFDSIRTVQGEPYRSADPIRLGVNGIVALTGPSGSGQFLELFDPLVATSVTVTGNVAIPSITSHDLTVATGGVLTPPRTRPAPALQLKVAGSLTVRSGGSIDASDRGYAPMATYSGASSATPSAGGSHLGRGGHNNGVSGETFGSVYRPREAGGGGGATSFASAGGGVVRIEAGTVAVEGAILANGAVNNTTGAGGSIWITAAAIRGSGTIEARGGDTNQIARGGGGAIAIEYTDPSSTLPNRRADTGGTGTLTHAFNGGAGTIYVKGPSSTYGELTIDGMGRVGQPTELPALGRGTAGSGSSGATLVTGRSAEIPPYFEGHWVEITGASGALKGTWRIGSILSRTVTLVPNAAGETVSIEPGDGWQGVYRFDSIRTVQGEPYRSADPIRLGVNGIVALTGPSGSGQFLELFDPLVATSVTVTGNVAIPSITSHDLTVATGGVLTPPRTRPAPALQLKVAGSLTVRSGGSIDASDRGYAPMATYSGASSATPSAGGSHLGRGGHNNGVSGETFGSVYRPREAGGGGGATSFASAGGGVVRIEAGTVAVEGAILANGAVNNTTGAGGSIWITAAAIRGSGTIEARGGDTNQIARGGGGAIAIEYTDPSSTLPNRRADTGGTGTLTHAFNGGAGTIYVKGPSSTYGELTIDGMGRVGQPTELPALGRGTAGSGSSGATLVTGRSAEIPPYFEGHWVEITGASGALKGTWRIGSILSRTVTLVPNAAGETVSIEPGDGWQGVYRLDSLTLRTARLVTADRLRVSAPPDVGAGSVILGDNAGPPVVDASRLSIAERPTGVYAVGAAGAVLDADQPVTVTARNSSGGAFSGAAAPDGSFAVQVFGAAGEMISLSARDSNWFPLESAAVAVGTLPSASAAATQLSRSAWTTDTNFRSQTVVADGTLLAVAASTMGTLTSDKLVILDISSPSSPVHIRTVATGLGPTRDIDAVDGWMYVAAGRLATLDLHSVTSTLNVAANDPGGNEQAVAIAGGYAFTSSDVNDGTIHVYDVTDPAAPRLVRSQAVVPAEGVVTDLIPYGSDYLVGLIDNSSSFDVRVIDRRNVNQLVRVGGVSVSAFSARRGSILGSRLYAASPSSSELVVIDLANPASPAVAGRLPLPAGGAGHVRIAADLAFVANNTGGLTATSLEPSNFAVIGNAATAGVAQDVAITAGFAYVANENGLAVMPISTAPVLDARRMAVVRSGTEVMVRGSARSITGRGNLTGTVRNVTSGAAAAVRMLDSGGMEATVVASGGDALAIDLSDGVHQPISRSLNTAPFAAVEIDAPAIVPGHSAFAARRLALDSDATLITGGTLLGVRVSGSTGVYLFRQPNASESAQIITSSAAGDEVNDSTLRAGFGYFAGSRFSTINFQNATPTTNTASSDPTGRQFAIALIGTYAFVAGDASSNGSIHVYDVSAPTTPVFVRTQAMSTDGPAIYRSLTPFGSGRLIAISPDGSRDVTVIDVSNPLNLQRLATLEIPSFAAHGGMIAGSTLYLAGGDAGVAVVDLTTALAPRHLATRDTPGIAFAVAASAGDEIVVADGSRGLTFLDVAIPGQPQVLGTQPLPGSTTDVKVVNGHIHAATETRYVVLRR